MPKKATLSVSDCRKLSQGATTWAEFQSALKGTGCSQQLKSQIWSEMKETVPKAKSTTQTKKSAASKKTSSEVQDFLEEGKKQVSQDTNTYRIGLRLVPTTDEDNPVKNASTFLENASYQPRMKEIIEDSLYGFNVKSIVFYGNEATVTVQSNPKSVIFDPMTAAETIKDTYGAGANDGWMEGDITLDDDYELFLELLYIDIIRDKSLSTQKSSESVRKTAIATPAAPATKSRAPRKSIEKKKSNEPKPSRGCVAQTTQKYTSRSSPAYPANECCGEVKFGQGKNALTKYVSKSDRNGVCKWVVLK